jgi:hypothetical protein
MAQWSALGEFGFAQAPAKHLRTNTTVVRRRRREFVKLDEQQLGRSPAVTA